MKNEMEELYGSNEKEELLLSYSRLSDYDRNGPRALINRTKVDSNAVFIGSLVDDLTLNKECFEDKYFIFNGSKPTATLGKLADIIIKNYNKLPSTKVILNIIKDNEFWKRVKEETLIGYIEDEMFINYILSQFMSKDKILLTTEQLAKGNELSDILITHKYSRDILVNELENHNQFKFNIKYKGVKIRGIIDKLLIDHKNKTIQIIDLKTGQGSISDFKISFIKWRYYLQAIIYQKAISYILKKFKLKDYKLLDFKFLYISTYEKIPCIFTISDKWLNAATEGFTTSSGYTYNGLDTLIDQIKWHHENNIYDLTKQIYENNGVIPINDSYIEIK